MSDHQSLQIEANAQKSSALLLTQRGKQNDRYIEIIDGDIQRKEHANKYQAWLPIGSKLSSDKLLIYKDIFLHFQAS